MINAETLAMLRLAPAPTLRQLMMLAVGGSPYLTGWEPDEKDAELAGQVLEMPGATSAEIEAMVATALRPLECIVPSGKSREGGSELPDWSPEWLAEVVSMAAQALPSLGWEQTLDLPAVLVMHLILAAVRRRGGTTRRPVDEDGAIEWLKQQEASDAE